MPQASKKKNSDSSTVHDTQQSTIQEANPMSQIGNINEMNLENLFAEKEDTDKKQP